jgi:16S rRNA (cytidine1402-2'-O)-methyltransferase
MPASTPPPVPEDGRSDAPAEASARPPVALWVVATPIGHLDDCSPRAVATLREVDLVLCEDTRRSRTLLARHAIDTPMKAVHEHNEEALVPALIQRLQAGEVQALITDAGTPLVSDPGYRLVAACHEHGLRVAPVPGPSAALAALSVAGLPSDRWCFEGFLPSRAGARRRRLESLAASDATLLFFEAPQRLLATLQAMVDVFGETRLACRCRELTKAYETVQRSTLAELAAAVAADADQRRGEQVIAVAPATNAVAPADAAVLALYRELCALLPPARAAALLARHLGVDRRALYEARARGD